MPQDGADTLRMLQFLELVCLRARPCAPGSKTRPQVPEKFLLLYTCSTKCFYAGCPALLAGTSLIYRMCLSTFRLVPLKKVDLGTT